MQRCDWVVFLPFAGAMVLLSGAIDIQAFDMFSGVADGNSMSGEASCARDAGQSLSGKKMDGRHRDTPAGRAGMAPRRSLM